MQAPFVPSLEYLSLSKLAFPLRTYKNTSYCRIRESGEHNKPKSACRPVSSDMPCSDVFYPFLITFRLLISASVIFINTHNIIIEWVNAYLLAAWCICIYERHDESSCIHIAAFVSCCTLYLRCVLLLFLVSFFIPPPSSLPLKDIIQFVRLLMRFIETGQMVY